VAANNLGRSRGDTIFIKLAKLKNHILVQLYENSARGRRICNDKNGQ
jgi:hypothetical protein